MAGVRGRIVPQLQDWARGVGSKTMLREVSQEERKKRRIQVTDERKGTECQNWLGKFSMTGISVLQNRAIDLKSKGRPADDSGNGIGDASLLYSTCSHYLGRGMDIQSRCTMRKLSTGEPCAGEPHARFGGRGGESLPYPYPGGD